MTDRRFPAPGLARRLLAPIAALLGLVAGLSVLILPSPAPTTADPTEFSAERAMISINRLADEPHSVLRREAHDRARDDVIGMFTDLGYTPTVHSDPMFDLSDPADKRIFDDLSAVQQATLKDAPTDTIVVDVPGKSERTMALMAHYDSATVEADENGHQQITDGTSLGAADDGYGVAAIVETLRALKAEGRQPENSLKIVITDGEEIGLVGARNEMRHHRADYENVDLVLNLEARGTSGPALMFETSPNNSAVAGYFLSHVEQPATGSLLPSLYARMPNTTDMAALIPEGFTVLNIAAIGAVAVRARSLRWKRVLGTVWGLTWRAALASAAAGLVQLGAMAMNVGAGERARTEPSAGGDVRRRDPHRGWAHSALRGAALEGGARAGGRRRGAAPAGGRLRATHGAGVRRRLRPGPPHARAGADRAGTEAGAAGGRGPGGLRHRSDPCPRGPAHPRDAQPQRGVGDRVLRDRAGGAAGARAPAGRFPAHRLGRWHRIRACFRRRPHCRSGHGNGVGRRNDVSGRNREHGMLRGLGAAPGEWPRGPGLWRRWTGAGSDGGWCTSLSSAVFHRVASKSGGGGV